MNNSKKSQSVASCLKLKFVAQWAAHDPKTCPHKWISLILDGVKQQYSVIKVIYLQVHYIKLPLLYFSL